MILQRLHPKGPQFSRIIAGAWRWHSLSGKEVENVIHAALAAGITTFDHADIYGNYSCEEVFGNALQNNPSLRNQLQLVTKCGIKLISDKRPAHTIKHYDTSREHIIWSVENSLQKLHTDRIDLLLLHRPDPLLHPAEVAETFSQLRNDGKVLYFGVSNFTTAQFEMLQSYLPFPLVTNQIELSLFNNTALFDGTTDVLLKHHVSPMAWSPLGGGKHFENEALMKGLLQLSEQYNATTTQLLLAWLLKLPSAIFPIVGTTKTERIREAATALHVNLTREHWFGMLKMVAGKDVA